MSTTAARATAPKAGATIWTNPMPRFQGGHPDVVKAFAKVCKKRQPAEFLRDGLELASLNRDLVRQRPVMEFAATLPEDELTVDPGSRLDPVTCQVVTRFTPRP